jgi:hypothetical protein
MSHLISPVLLSEKRHILLKDAAHVLWCSKQNPASNYGGAAAESGEFSVLHPDLVKDRAQALLLNDVMRIFVTTFCPDYQTDRRPEGQDRTKEILAKMSEVVTRAFDANEAGGAISLPAKKQFMVEGTFGPGGRAAAYLGVFNGGGQLGRLFLKATSGQEFTNVLTSTTTSWLVRGSGGSVTDTLLAGRTVLAQEAMRGLVNCIGLHVESEPGGDLVSTTCGHGYLKVNLQWTRFYLGLTSQWLRRNGHSHRHPRLYWLNKNNKYATMAVGNAERFSGICTSAAQNWIVFSLGIPITWLSSSEWVFSAEWLAKHGFSDAQHGVLLALVAMIIEELEAMSMFYLFPALVASNASVRTADLVANSTGTGLSTSADRMHGREPEDVLRTMYREVARYLHWMIQYGPGSPDSSAWHEKWPVVQGQESELTAQYAIVREHQLSLKQIQLLDQPNGY